MNSQLFFFFFLFCYFFFFKQKTAYEILAWLEFRRVLFRSRIPQFYIPPRKELRNPSTCKDKKTLRVTRDKLHLLTTLISAPQGPVKHKDWCKALSIQHWCFYSYKKPEKQFQKREIIWAHKCLLFKATKCF